MKKFELGPKDKQPRPGGWGQDFRHTEPQRRVPCIVGTLLAPASADDIAPISASAATSVQQAFALLANLVGDHDHNMFMGNANHDGRATREAEAITRACRGVMAILRIAPLEFTAPDGDMSRIPTHAYRGSDDGCCERCGFWQHTHKDAFTRMHPFASEEHCDT